MNTGGRHVAAPDVSSLEELPEYLKVPAVQRRAAWDRCPPKPMPAFADRHSSGAICSPEKRRELEKAVAAEAARYNLSTVLLTDEPPRSRK